MYDEETSTTVPVEVDVEQEQELEYFFGDKVRKVWHKQEEEWYFSIVDVCQVLTDSVDGRKYWNKLKQRLIEEGNETVTNCHQLKMKASDGKMRKTDAATMEQILRIIQSIPSKKAESFKLWLTKTKKSLTEDEENSYTETLFESIKHINEYGQEFWYARDLQNALEYKRWDKFLNVISKAQDACSGSGNNVDDHFSHVGKIVEAGVTYKDIGDIELSRYACYLIVQNADPHKKVIALGQTYFAVKTRQAELIENFEKLTEKQKRIATRHQMKEHNKLLVAAAKDAGVETSLDYAIFQNYGYQEMLIKLITK